MSRIRKYNEDALDLEDNVMKSVLGVSLQCGHDIIRVEIYGQLMDFFPPL